MIFLLTLTKLNSCVDRKIKAYNPLANTHSQTHTHTHTHGFSFSLSLSCFKHDNTMYNTHTHTLFLSLFFITPKYTPFLHTIPNSSLNPLTVHLIRMKCVNLTLSNNFIFHLDIKVSTKGRRDYRMPRNGQYHDRCDVILMSRMAVCNNFIFWEIFVVINNHAFPWFQLLNVSFAVKYKYYKRVLAGQNTQHTCVC